MYLKPSKIKRVKLSRALKKKIMGLYKKVRGEAKEDDLIKQEQRERYKSVLRELRERPQITLLEAHPRVHRYKVTGSLNNNLSKMIFNRIRQDIEMCSRIVYSFTAKIYRWNGEIVDYVKTLPGEGTFMSLTSIKNYIKHCENRRLDLDDSLVWSRAHLPPTRCHYTWCLSRSGWIF